MPEPVTVWMVHLGPSPREVEGLLRLDDDALVFAHDAKPAELRFPFAAIARTKRPLGSPVIVVDWRDEGRVEPRRTAFYFAKPPPLQPPDVDTVMREAEERGRHVGQFGTMRATSKRRHHRRNVGYLGLQSNRMGPTIKAWITEIRVKVAEARRD
jgi:hypothetical protein